LTIIISQSRMYKHSAVRIHLYLFAKTIHWYKFVMNKVVLKLSQPVHFSITLTNLINWRRPKPWTVFLCESSNVWDTCKGKKHRRTESCNILCPFPISLGMCLSEMLKEIILQSYQLPSNLINVNYNYITVSTNGSSFELLFMFVMTWVNQSRHRKLKQLQLITSIFIFSVQI
jgi:hypothetical protein